jgi:hypothetical protein
MRASHALAKAWPETSRRRNQRPAARRAAARSRKNLSDTARSARTVHSIAARRSSSRPLPRPRPVERIKARTRSPDSTSSSGSHVNISHASWTSATNRRIPSWPSYTAGFSTRSDMSRRKEGSHMATSPSTSPLFSASCARRIVSTLLDIGQSQYPGRRAPVATQQPGIRTRDRARCRRDYWSGRL